MTNTATFYFQKNDDPYFDTPYYAPYYTPIPETDYHEWMFEQIKCPNCGKILKPHICGEKDE